MDRGVEIRKRKTGSQDVVEAVNESILALAGHLAEYVSVLKRAENGLAVRNKQRA